MLSWRVVAAGVFACGLCAGANYGSIPTAQASTSLPVRAVMITMAHDEHAQFVEQFSEFAAENAFEIRIAPPKLDPTDVLIQMRREDVKLLASPIIDPGITDLRYDVAIYENEGRAASVAALDQLINDLRAFVERIDGITTTVLK